MLARKLDLDEFQFSQVSAPSIRARSLGATPLTLLRHSLTSSQSYLFFWDSLSKANFFLESMLDLADTPVDDRTVQYLMSEPENDGGQWGASCCLRVEVLLRTDEHPSTHITQT